MSTEARKSFLKTKALIALDSPLQELRQVEALLNNTPGRNPPKLAGIVKRSITALEKAITDTKAIPITNTERRNKAIAEEARRINKQRGAA